MDFSADKPIFRQIVDLCHARILSGEWVAGQKIPSVREMAIELAVNSRTVLNAFDLLEKEQVIASRRGLGFFLSDDAVAMVREAMREDFFNQSLPKVFSDMASLGIGIDEVISRWNESEKTKENK